MVVTVELAPKIQDKISAAKLAAGRAAFLRKRGKLSDLYDFFDSDLDEFLATIFQEMTTA